MRKLIKKQSLNLLTTLIKSQSVTDRVIRKGTNLMELLTDQQEAAIVIGNQIEEFEGEGTEAVRLLEEYCELLWQMSQIKKKNELLELRKQGEKLLLQVKQCIVEMSEQNVVVFLPYKASMWDCMESVWEAACEEEDCTPIVMPIPYFDIEGGKIAQTHYEIDKFPAYVPVVDYRELSLEQLKPDIIFVHNPFDGYNRVTTVLPQFYSDKLREIAGRLVYIPYYMSGDSVFVTHRYIPSYDNMDFIVTQSEKMIESYAEGIPREKFLPFGSPIADRVIKLEKEKPPIPEEWKSMLPNGRDFGESRVVMLNTSISVLLKEKERFINKLEYIFDAVKDVAGILIVWRPHPLLKASIASLGKRYEQRFEQLEKKFLQEKIGVLDKTPDIGIAAALCDAYLGETASSVPHLFGVAGKPRFYINLQVPRESAVEKTVEYTISGFCKEEKREYFVLDEPGWIATQEAGGELLPLVKIPNREYIWGRAFSCMELKDNCLWMYPENAQGILIYNLQTKMFKKIFEENQVTKNTNQNGDGEKLVLDVNSTCAKTVKAERFQRGNLSYIWHEGQKSCLEDFLRFLLATEKDKLTGVLSGYQQWLASLDGSCGRKVLQAVIDSLNEG